MKRYQENEEILSDQKKIYYEKNRDVLLTKSKINQQNRKSHTQQIQNLNNKVEELTRTVEMLILKIE